MGNAIFGTTGANTKFLLPPPSIQVLHFDTAKCSFHDYAASPAQGGFVDSVLGYAERHWLHDIGGTGLSAAVASIIRHKSLMWECILSSSLTVINHLLQN